MFPRGAPGVALLLLRISVATDLLLSVESDPHRAAWRLVLTLALVCALGVGFLTPITAVLTIPVYLIETASIRLAPAEVLSLILQAIALSLLGPGACSIDAYLYGHRVVELPKKGDREAN
jgi:putative oxidoreductase